VPEPALPVPPVGLGWPLVPGPEFSKWELILELLPVPLLELRTVIEPLLFEVDEPWWFDDPEPWWFDDPCVELLDWADPLRDDPDGPRAKAAVEAKVRLITVARRKVGFNTRRMTGSPVGVGGVPG
jgi:hypothetical protein